MGVIVGLRLSWRKRALVGVRWVRCSVNGCKIARLGVWMPKELLCLALILRVCLEVRVSKGVA